MGRADPGHGAMTSQPRRAHERPDANTEAVADTRSRGLSTRIRVALLASAFVVLSLAATLSSQPGTYIGDARLEHVTEPGQYLTRQAYLWDDARGLGKPMSHFFFAPAPAAFQAGLAALGAEPWLIQRLTHALFFSLAALGVILLMREFLPRIGFPHAIAAFVYTFSPFTTQFLLPSNLFLHYALAPWFAWIALRGVRDRDPWRWAAAFALTIAAVGTLNVGNLGWALLPAVLTALYGAWLERGGFARLWRWAWRSGLLSVLTCSAALVVLWFSAPEAGASLRVTELPEQVARTSSWFETWRGLGFWQTYPDFFGLFRDNATPYFTAAGVILATFVASLGALLALALMRWRHRLLFGAMLLVSLVAMVGAYGDGSRSPFGELLFFAFERWDFARGFRTTYKAGPGLMLAIAALLGAGVGAALAAARQEGPRARPPLQRSRMGLRRLAFGLVVPMIALWRVARGSRADTALLGLGVASAFAGAEYGSTDERPTRRPPSRVRRLVVRLAVAAVASGVVVASFPFWTARLYPEDIGFRSIPGYWVRAFDYLEAQQQPGRVLVLPAPERGRYRWGDVHDNLFDGFSALSPLMNNISPQATPESYDLLKAIDEYVSSRGYVQGTLGPMLERLGVRWVILQNDLAWQQGGVPRPAAFDAVRSDPGLSRAATFGRRGQNTFSRGDAEAKLFGERSLPPVEVYEVAGTPSPRPRLAAGPPLLVAGGGDSWPALAAGGLLHGPPVAYTGALDDPNLRELLASGSELVVTDGNRRRARSASIGRPSESPTLAVGGAADRTPEDLFGSPESQSVATYPDAERITGSRYGDVLQYDASSRPANAFDRVERTAWKVQGSGLTGASVTVELRQPVTITAVSALPYADGSRAVKAIDVTAYSQDGGQVRKRLDFGRAEEELPVARFDAAGVTAVEFTLARLSGGAGSVGITEAALGTPGGQLDLREFVRTPDDLGARAASDRMLAEALAEQPPRYELRRITSGAGQGEETEMRREITTFGDHRYELELTARVDGGTADSAVDSLLGHPVGAVATSRLEGRLARSGGRVVDDDFTTGWEPELRAGQRVDVRFPATEVETVEALVLSGPPSGVARSRVTDVKFVVGDEVRSSSLPRARRCLPESPAGGCLEAHVVQMPSTRADGVSLALTGIDRIVKGFDQLPARVVEVRINDRDWSEASDPSVRETCAPLVAIDGDPVQVRLPRNPDDLFSGGLLELEGCHRIRLGPGRHRIETLPGLSGAVLTASLVSAAEKQEPRKERGKTGTVELLDRSPTRLSLQVDSPQGVLLMGGMPWHDGWVGNGGELRRFPVPLDTFAAWTVEEPTAGPVTLQFQPQAAFELAIALSIGAVAWCGWRVTRRRARRR